MTGTKIAELRLSKGLSQSGLARILGTSRQRVHKWEKGQVKIGIDQAAKIAGALGCKLDDLVEQGVA